MKNTKKVAYGGIVAALSIVLLLVASYLEVMDISAVVIVSLGIVFMQLEFGTAASVGTFTAVSLLSLLLLPSKIPAFMYICFGGWYPIVKRFLEKLTLSLSIVLKLVVFNMALALYAVVTFFVLMLEMPEDILKIALIVGGNLVFLLYDYVLSRLIAVYIVKIRDRFEKYLR